MEVSLALSGSGFKFPVHVGAIRAIEDNGHEIVEIAGVSGGALVASLLACDIPISTLVALTLDQDWTKYQSFQWRALGKGGINTGEKIHSLMDSLTEGRLFREVSTPLSIVGTDLHTGEEVLFSKETTPDATLSEAVRASISIPVLFTPYEYRGKLLVDGVACNSLPVNHLVHPTSKKVGVKIIDTGPDTEAAKDVASKPWPWRVATQAFLLLVDKPDYWVHQAEHFADLVGVDTQYAKGLDPNLPEEVRARLMQDGYEEMLKWIVEQG